MEYFVTDRQTRGIELTDIKKKKKSEKMTNPAEAHKDD